MPESMRRVEEVRRPIACSYCVVYLLQGSTMQSTQKAWAGGGNTQRKKEKHVRFHTPRMRLHMTRNTISLGEQRTLLAGIRTAWRKRSTEQVLLKALTPTGSEGPNGMADK